MANGFLDIQIAGQEVATVNEIVSFEATGWAPEVMPVVGYGATGKMEISLGNVSGKGKCTVTKYWDTAEDAWAWFQANAAALAGVNNILITKTCVDGILAVWLWTNAKVSLSVQEPINMTTITVIEWEGPAPALVP